MGTVGLNFGSPTSGAGFNVSSTVAEIISNLQNVETPWKNQLSSLESQDTAISSLGSLLSNVSTDISQLTDAQGVLAQKEGSSSDTNVLELTTANSTAVADTHTVVVNSLAQTSSGYLAEIASSNDTLSGSVTLKVGSGETQTITLNSTNDTLAGLASAINSSGLSITANVLTDASGSRLSLVSGISGANGNIVVTNNSIAAAASNTLGATVTAGTSTTTSSVLLSPVVSSSEQLTGTLNVTVGSGNQQTINMSDVNSAENGTTLADLQQYIHSNSSSLGFDASIVTNSDGTASLQLTSGTANSAGRLAVSSSLVDPSTALAYTSTVTGANANLTVDGVNLTSASNTVSNLIPGVTFQLLAPSPQVSGGGLEQVQVLINNDNTGVESAVNQFVSDYNSLISAVNTQEGNTSSGTPEPLFGSPTLSLLQQELLSSLNTQNPNGSLSSVTNNLNPALSGSMTIQVGDGTTENVVIGAAPSSPAANTIYTGSGVNTLSDLAQAINSADIGVTAGVATSGGQSTLTLASQTAGSTGALTVTSNIVAASETPLRYTGTNAIGSQPSQGTLTSIPSASDTLTGSISVQVGAGSATTIDMSAVASAQGSSTLTDLENYINNPTNGFGFTASIVPNSGGPQSLSLVSGTSGSSGNLSVSSGLIDTTSTTNATLGYTNSSDINSLTTLGISVNNDGSLTFDANSLDSVLNTDYASVTGFFQNANSWGQSFSNMLSNAGSSSSSGMLSLAASANSSIESTLNADITKEESTISAQQSSLTTELNQANEVLEELPSQLQGMNELYSAITGYNQGENG
jgi:flagellar hook-associated protein 2